LPLFYSTCLRCFLAMKSVFLVVAALAVASGLQKETTITKVVKLLQSMLVKSDKESKEETQIYGKFKCFCDGAEKEKKASISELTKQISLFNAKIDETKGNSGELGSDCGDLKTKMAENKASRKGANAIRATENKEFKASKSDLEQAVGQMKAAIEKLTKVGADQTSAKAGADNKKFMGGFKGSLVSLNSEVSQALTAARAYMTSEHQAATSSLLQAPFTGTYTSQSTEVMGILKSMRDTFKANLEEAVAKENQAATAHNAFMKVKTASAKEMSSSYDDKQKELGENDATLAAKRSQLAQAVTKKSDDEDTLAKLKAMYAKKTNGYDARKLMRANEDAAIAECVSILNSDAAFDTFSTVDATTKGALKGAFIQMHSVRHHMDLNEVGMKQAKNALQGSARLSKVAALLQAPNPFKGALKEINKMINVIKLEGESDKKKRSWCIKERKENNKDRKDKTKELLSLDEQIDKFTKTIEDPVQGLKKQIHQSENSLEQNTVSQGEQTKQRLAENLNYQKDVKNLVQTQAVLTKGIKVLANYYDNLEKRIEAGLLQKGSKGVKAAPEAWKGEGKYEGQSKQGGDAVTMLEFIRSETQKEEYKAHTEEKEGQHDFEDSMTKLKKEEADTQKSIAKLQETLAGKEKELLEASGDRASTKKDRDAVKDYLAKIKAGCDFVQSNFALREKSRKTETKSLVKAKAAIRGTPAFTMWRKQTLHESYGKCKAKCVKDDKHVVCKACMADVSVPGFCAGHPKAKGC